MPDPLDFTGKVVLVTGSSRGIGAEMTKAFGKRGATCVVNYFTDPQGQNKADAESVAKELKDPLVIDCDVRVNLTGTFNATQKAIPILRNGGRIVNLSSVSGQMGLFGQANYSSSKAAIIALTKVSARELARQNITVNAIAPGFIDVGMSKGMPDEVTENFKKQIPLGRLGDVREIVDAALFLASPMASYITGR